MTTLVVAAAGALGAAARYLVDHGVSHRLGASFPWGTLTVNVVGSLVGGAVVGLVVFADLPSTVALVAGVGFAGSFTTFSTFAFDTVQLAQSGRRRAALASAAGNLLASLAAAGGGFAIVAAVS